VAAAAVDREIGPGLGVERCGRVVRIGEPWQISCRTRTLDRGKRVDLEVGFDHHIVE